MINSPSTANTFMTLQPELKVQYPNQSQRKKRFAKIREQIKGKR